MPTQYPQSTLRFRSPASPLSRLCLALALTLPLTSFADTVPQPLPFAQDWSNTSQISANDSWSAVPGVMGYRGDGLASTGADPQAVLSDGTAVVDVNANQTAVSFNTGGVAEFQIDNPVVALQGSGTADAPHIVLHLNTLGQESIQLAYLLRDIDSTADNAVQRVALQYRVGNSGNFTNLPAGYVADASTGPSLATATFPISVTLPPDAANQAEVQVRIITADASGSDEWIGIDDISVTGTPIGGGFNAPIAVSCPASASVTAGSGGSFAFSASDSDSVVTSAVLAAGAPAGVAIGSFSAASLDGESASGSVDVAASVPAGTYALQLDFGNNELQSASCTVQLIVDGLITIPQIQGSDVTSPLAGQQVTTRGVVTHINSNGYFLQDPTGDGNPATSDGIFVFTGSAPGGLVAVGNELRVTGTVAEFAVGGGAQSQARPVTELTNSSATLLGSGPAIAPLVITLPEVQDGELERYEGMLVRIASLLTASQNYFQGRYGQVTLSADGRLEKPTNRHPANSADALAMADDNARRRILLDDGSSGQNPNPTPYIGADNTLRAGDTLPDGITGVIDYGLATNLSDGLSDYRIHPTEPVNFVRSNPRTGTPGDVGGNVRVGSFNVLNYFTTLDAAGNGCFPSGTRSDCRGADTPTEFQRQRDKIIPAILGLGADVVGLMEIENNGNTAVQDLVNGLNAVAGAGTWATVAMPAQGSGTDAIRVAMIYQPARLSPVGAPLSDVNPIHDRPPLAQAFAAPNGERFSVVVNHFKSKNCSPTPSGGNIDQGDGQGCYNALRTEQAQALAGFVATLQSVDPDVAVIGDLNAYGKEDPILSFLGAGYTDEIDRFNDLGYSYVFDGESGYLDHALTTPTLSAQVTGALHWHINADEPSVIDYNQEFKLGHPNCGTCGPDYYSATVYRSSDHDPVLLGLSLFKRIDGGARRDTLVGTAGDDRISGGAGADTITTGAGRDVVVFNSTRDAIDTVTDFVPGSDRLDLSALLASIGRDPAAALGDGVVRLVDTPAGLSLQIDIDGLAGPAVPRPLVVLQGVGAAAIQPARDLGL